MNAPELRHLSTAPELAQLETTHAVLRVLLLVLQHRHPDLEDHNAISRQRTLAPARTVAQRARALLDAIRRYHIEVDEARLDAICRPIDDCEIPF